MMMPLSQILLLNVRNFISSFLEGNIEFLDSGDLSRTVEAVLLEPDEPFTLCSSNKNTLYYADWYGSGQVKLLNCQASLTTLRHQSNLNVNRVVTDMCIIDQKLVTVAANGVDVFNISTKALEYKIPGILPKIKKQHKISAVTSIRLGYLFVCDTNNRCVHMFNINAGNKYMGVLLKAGENGLGELSIVRWSDKLSSLLVAHCVSSKYLVSVVKLAILL